MTTRIDPLPTADVYGYCVVCDEEFVNTSHHGSWIALARGVVAVLSDILRDNVVPSLPRRLGLRDKLSRLVTESRSSEGHLLLEQLSLSAGDFNVRAGVEPNRKSTVAR